MCIRDRLNIPLAGFKTSDVRTFVEKVRLCLNNIPSGEILDKKLLFQWLYERVKNWNAISSKIERLKDSSANSRKRSWEWLWAVINNHLARVDEDANYSNLAAGLAQGQVSGAPATAQAEQRKIAKAARKQAKAAAAAANANVQQAAAAAAAKGKGGGKGKSKGKGGKGDAGKGQKPYAEMTLQEKKKQPCLFFICLLYTSPSPRDRTRSRMPSSA